MVLLGQADPPVPGIHPGASSQTLSEVNIETQTKIKYFVKKEQEGLYLTVPFSMPEGIESVTIAYRYDRHQEIQKDAFTSRQEVNIIDLGLIAPDGHQVGASGSNKTLVKISETDATPGYDPCPLVPGEWRILLGAYKVAAAGVEVSYELTFSPKKPRWFKGDLHLHTIGSDGVLKVDELAVHALRNGLDFLAITDHNQMVASATFPRVPGMTLIPGIEWTHYQGHANFIGVDKPYDEPFFTGDFTEVQARFKSARERGAFISLNHPFDEACPWKFDLESLPYDCLEIWNGPMRVSNLQSVGMWQQMLMAGKKIPICGGSDYHRDHLFIMLGGPTTCVYAKSASPADVLAGVKQGHAFLTFAPDGPSLEMTAGEAMMGDSVTFKNVKEINLNVQGLLTGDILQVVTGKGSSVLLNAEADGSYDGVYKMDSPGFARVEILRGFIPGIPHLPALISNPIYFDDGKS